MGTSRLKKARPFVLQHINIPGHPYRPPTYALAVAIQSKLQQRLLDYKTAVAANAADLSRPPPTPPPPTILSLHARPNLHPRPTADRATQRGRGGAPEGAPGHPLAVGNDHYYASFTPAIHTAPRGGLTTYHGPGQVVFWPVLDLKSPRHRHFSVRDYACLLEKTTKASVAAAAAAALPFFPSELVRQESIEGFTTENPGVWVRRRQVDGMDDEATKVGGDFVGPDGEERKIAALGVHLSRHVTGLGVAVNCSMPVRGAETLDPWRRIVACGLEGKRVTSLAYELLDYNRPLEWTKALKPLRPLDSVNKNPGAAPRLETEMLRSWPEIFARSIADPWFRPSSDSPLVVNSTLDEVLGKGWEKRTGIPEEEQYYIAERKPIVDPVGWTTENELGI
ncbi:hypothetical protein PG999_000377 [Apiospora kogelbergensis]|uniref:BPL/LPL catalytic domain-containing protein n=1 Tax=Apiospora kogelbergensis TaxID=1337665 RepID=A0AAW0RBQ3_9PEZI